MSLLVAGCLAGCDPAVADDPTTPKLLPTQIQTSMTAGLNAVRSEEWNKAVENFRAVVNADSTHQQAVFYLGYSLHNAKQFAEAITYHEQASKFPRYTQTALYNWACALALQNEKAKAIAKLKEAVEMGFVHRIDIVADPDMESLIGDPEFEKLRRRAMPFSQREVHQQLDFLIGDWDELDENGNYVGKSRVSREDGSTMLTEQWTGRDGKTATGRYLYDSKKQKWIRTSGNSAGIAVSHEGELVGNIMKLTGRAFYPNGRSVSQRLSLSPSTNGVVLKIVEESQDGGIEWTEVFSGKYKRPARKTSVE